MKRLTRYVLKEITPTHARGLQAFETREAAERAMQGRTQSAELRYEVEEVEEYVVEEEAEGG